MSTFLINKETLSEAGRLDLYTLTFLGGKMDADLLNLVQSIVLAVLGFFAAKKGREK